MLKIIENLPPNVLGISAEGEVTGTDYKTVLIPAVKEILKTNKKIRMLYNLGPDFKGFDLAAMVDDAMIGMKHFTAWEKVALVSDHQIINGFAKFFGHMLPGEVKIFKNNELQEAEKWIST